MANSSKKISKVVAIAMASAMAMSSLSAALVSVSAVEDPALSSTGSVDFISGDKEDAILAHFNADSDQHTDAMAGKSLDLSKVSTDIVSALEYTDADGLTSALTNTEVKYRVTSGGTYAEVIDNKTLKTTAGKSGSATLQIKVTGDADLGGGKGEKSVTFTYNIYLDIHQANELGLVAQDADGNKICESDLNDLAAYGSSVTYTLGQYKEQPGSKDFFADFKAVTVGTETPDNQPPNEAEQEAQIADDVVAALLKKKPELTDKKDEMVQKLKSGLESLVTVGEGDKVTITDENLKQALDIELVAQSPATNFKETDQAVKDAVADYAAKNSADFIDLSPKTREASKLYFSKKGSKPDNIQITVGDQQKDIYTASGTKEGKLLKNVQGDGYLKVLQSQEVVEIANGTFQDNGFGDQVSSADVAKTKLKEAIDANVDGSDTNLAKIVYTGTQANDLKFFYKGNQSTANTELVKFCVDKTNGKVSYESGGASGNKIALFKGATENSNDAYIEGEGVVVKAQRIEDVYTYTLQKVENPDSATAQVKVSDAVTAEELKKIVADAFNNAADKTPEGDVSEDVDLLADAAIANTVTGVRFYAGTGAELFNESTGKEWEKSTKTNTDKGIIIESSSEAKVTLNTKGDTGSGSVKVAVDYTDDQGAAQKTKELVVNVKVVKAADFADQDVALAKSGSKTLATTAAKNPAEDKNLSGFDIRTTGDVSMENGSVGKITAQSLSITGGKAGDVDATGNVDISEDGVVGNIIGAGAVSITDGGAAGDITDATSVTVNDGTVNSIDIDGDITLEGGAVAGDVKATGNISISSDDTDTNDNAMDTTIGGNVILLGTGEGDAKKISINNLSEDGAAELSIAGNVVAKHIATDVDVATVEIGDGETTGKITIGGVVEGEYISLGGNGLVNLAGVKAGSEVERSDEDAAIVDSTLEFNGFNSAINGVSGFADVKVNEGTVSVSGAMSTTNLTVESDAQIVANTTLNVEEDIIGSGSIVVPVGGLTVTGSVDDAPSLAFTGTVTVDSVAFVGNRGLADSFELGGIVLKAEKQANGNYNYLVSEAEFSGLTAVRKDVATGVKQTKEVSVALDGALPQNASIVWEVDDKDVATVTGNGATATITGVEIGNTTVTAKIVDANGRDMGYDDATFEVNVLSSETADSIGSTVSVDTVSKNMQVGETYNFLVRDIKDTDNIKLSYDANIVDVKLAQADYNGRGALYTITAKANGSTNIGVTYKGATSNIAVKVGGFVLDTSAKTMTVGQTYSFLAKNVKIEEAGNVQFTYDNTVAKVELAQADYNGRGALFTVTALKTGSTDIKATYNNEEATMKLDVVEYTGKMTLDTASYTMPLGGTYTIGVKIEKNGKELTGAEVNAMIASGELVVRDSRTGTIINKPEVLANGNVRVTGKNTEGTTYVMFEIVKDGKVATHASIGVTVKAGATAGGSSRRSVSQW